MTSISSSYLISGLRHDVRELGKEIKADVQDWPFLTTQNGEYIRVIYTGSYIQFLDFSDFRILGKIPLKSLREAVLWEKLVAKMLIGCVRKFLVLRICHKVDMGHVLSGFHVFVELMILVKHVFPRKCYFSLSLQQNPTTEMTAGTMGSFHGFGKKWSRHWYLLFRSHFL